MLEQYIRLLVNCHSPGQVSTHVVPYAYLTSGFASCVCVSWLYIWVRGHCFTHTPLSVKCRQAYSHTGAIKPNCLFTPHLYHSWNKYPNWLSKCGQISSTTSNAISLPRIPNRALLMTQSVTRGEKLYLKLPVRQWSSLKKIRIMQIRGRENIRNMLTQQSQHNAQHCAKILENFIMWLSWISYRIDSIQQNAADSKNFSMNL